MKKLNYKAVEHGDVIEYLFEDKNSDSKYLSITDIHNMINESDDSIEDIRLQIETELKKEKTDTDWIKRARKALLFKFKKRRAYKELFNDASEIKRQLDLELVFQTTTNNNNKGEIMKNNKYEALHSIEGMSAQEVADSLFELSDKEFDQEAGYYNALGYQILYNQILINEAMERPWTLGSIRELIMMPDEVFVKHFSRLDKKLKEGSIKLSEAHVRALDYWVQNLFVQKRENPKTIFFVNGIVADWINSAMYHKKFKDMGLIN